MVPCKGLTDFETCSVNPAGTKLEPLPYGFAAIGGLTDKLIYKSEAATKISE
jgi:hypothetical protein